MSSRRLQAPRFRLQALIAVVAVSSCGAPIETSTVMIELGDAPPQVATISFSVRDLDANELATSATIAAPKTGVSLGVPAETELEFLVIARTNRPGPLAIGPMPAYLGRAERTIALGREQELVSMTVHPAGVLTIVPVIEGEKRGLRGFRLEPEERGLQSVELKDPDERRSLVLRTGRYDAVVVEELKKDRPERAVSPSRGIFVAPEIESLVRLRFHEKAPPLSPSEASALSIDTGGDVITSSNAPSLITVRIEARSASGETVRIPTASVRVVIAADPFTALAGEASYDVLGLPATIPNVAFSGLGRAIVRARAVLSNERAIAGSAAFNILKSGTTAGAAAKLALSIADPFLLVDGTELFVSVLDARGLFASAQTGMLDLSASDPWAFFPKGALTAVPPADRGFVRRDLSRPSGPRGLPVIVRATLTSTVPALSLTASVTLPLLEIR